ncbi:integrin beta-PS-like [Harmonia axyridis]|uniref:integrin beta-PS-like n=1 Tax=Harmonia axyridis TaxID=115357 RepID=UPI001E276A76|nr:integrin beta-PS-like [Harmonia axyridis]
MSSENMSFVIDVHRIIVFAVLVSSIGVFSQDISVCDSKYDCGSCLQQSGCYWCIQPQLNKKKVLNHCISSDSRNITCPEKDRIDPKTKVDIIQNLPLSSTASRVVQIKPQRIKLSMRVKKTVNITFQFSLAKDYPVDLYYIIDNSYSMREHKDKLAALGKELFETMSNITNDFKIGFGSFIDKQSGPFVSQQPDLLKNPCGIVKCVPAYGFKNHLPLTEHFESFSKGVKEAISSGNMDSPEGGFDAIMQAIVCKKDIGWRPKARHLLIFSSDANFHIAGDGRLLGILEPNDAKCLMVNNKYDGLKNDYPSISHLSNIAKENDVNIIFAVVRKLQKIYKMLSENIVNSKFGVLDKKSQNVVKLVVDNYKEIVGSVNIETNYSRNIKVDIIPHCKKQKGNGCDGVKLGEVVNFTASITLLNCADNTSTPTAISIKPSGIDESLILEVNTICGCECESKTDKTYQKNSPECGGDGDLACGLCKCKEGHYGSKCECTGTSDEETKEKDCREGPESKICTGRGRCNCGMCDCNTNPELGRPYSGKFCECDEASCLKEKGEICNGKGKCICLSNSSMPICDCDAGWEGPSCACEKKDELCIKSGDKNICSGKGSCKCGACICSDDYSGTFCEVCPDCNNECSKLKTCVECKIFGLGIQDNARCIDECAGHIITSTSQTVEKNGKKEKICRELDQEKCEITFKYMYDDSQVLHVTVQKHRNCPPNILVWMIAVAGFVIMIGILTLLIWKIATILHDRREYAKFMREQTASQWHRGQNPLYKEATTTFENPYFSK